MAFTSTISSGGAVIGNKRARWGTFASTASDTGGNIDTGLRIVEFIFLQQTGSAVTADAPVVNETLPVAGSAVTIVTTADATGNWFAIGY